MRTWHISAVSGLACEQKKNQQKKDKNKRKRKEMAAKKQISIKKNCLVVCFFKWMAFSPFLPSFK